MRRWRLAALSLLTLLVAARPALAQPSSAPPAPVAPGDRVQVNGRGFGGIYTLQGWSAESIAVTRADGQRHAFARDTVRLLRVSRGLRTRGQGAWHGAKIGFLTGAAVGVVAGLFDGDDPADTFIAFTAEEKAVYLGAFTGAIGGTLGLLVGAASPGERWERVPLERLPSVTVGRSGAVQVGLRFPFPRAAVR